jgi:hypothetical protein
MADSCWKPRPGRRPTLQHKHSAPLMTVVRPLDGASAPGPLESDFKPESSVESESFKSEQDLARPAIARKRSRYLGTASAVLLVCGIVGTGSWFGWQKLRSSRPALFAPAASLGTAVFKSSPDGATIIIDGVARGTTPLKLALSAGQHTFTMTSGEMSRSLPLAVEAGSVFSQYVEFAAQPQPAGGRLEVGSDPAGAEVRIDGTLRGVAPLAIADIPVGPHKVTVSRAGIEVNRTVSVTPGSTAAVVISTGGAPVASAAAAGWLTIDAPFEMEVYEGNQLVGTTRSDRIMLPVGSHDLDLTNSSLEFSGRRTVKITPGKTASVNVSSPSGKLSVNAVPWAEVSIDGRPAGTTPLGNLTVPIGSHEVLWHHPQLGERRQTVTVKAQSPTRVGVDFGK